MEGERTTSKRGLSHFGARLREVTREDPLPVLFVNHVRIWRKFLNGPARGLARSSQRLVTRYIRPYLARSLTTPQRRQVLEYHHDFIIRMLDDEALAQVAGSGIRVWTLSKDAVEYSIRLTIDKSIHGEGDLVLSFHADGTEIYDLAFSFAPEDFFGGSETATLLIARVQGRRDRYEAMHAATKACGNVQASHLLLAAAEGLGLAFGIHNLRGVCREQQLASRWAEAKFDYDAFWIDQMFERSGAWFVGTVPLLHKPLANVVAHHRRRAKRKRQFRDALAAEVCQVLLARLRSPSTARPFAASELLRRSVYTSVALQGVSMKTAAR